MITFSPGRIKAQIEPQHFTYKSAHTSTSVELMACISEVLNLSQVTKSTIALPAQPPYLIKQID